MVEAYRGWCKLSHKKPNAKLFYCDICDGLIGESRWRCASCGRDICDKHINKDIVLCYTRERDTYWGGTYSQAHCGNLCAICLRAKNQEEEERERKKWLEEKSRIDDAEKLKKAKVNKLKEKLNLSDEELRLLKNG